MQGSLLTYAQSDRLLEADERNFHGWGYRQFLMELMQAAPEDEEAFAASKIDRNFSNYSAWHLKTRLLKKVHQQSPTVTLDELLKQSPAGGRWHAMDYAARGAFTAARYERMPRLL